MELRDIEIFLTLAEELHFSRTADRLHVTPARVTQAIKKQERQIGAPLFDRSNRAVRLTPLGRQLRDDLWPMYTGLHVGMRRAELAAQGLTAVLRVGMIPYNAHDLRRHWETFRSEHPSGNCRSGTHPTSTRSPGYAAATSTSWSLGCPWKNPI